MPPWLYIIYFFIVGSCVGSFLNVVVYRLPRGQSLVHPPSRCPNCQHGLAWYDNIPVFGWMLLAGKCRYCKKPISIRYPIVEAITGSLFVLVFGVIFLGHQGPFWAVYDGGGELISLTRVAGMPSGWPIFGLYLFTVACLLAASLIDLESYLIPASIPLWMAAVGLAVHTWIDRNGVPGALGISPAGDALAVGGTVGLCLSIILLRMGVFPLSFAEGESPLEVDKLNAAAGDNELREYSPAEVRHEMGKELLFLFPPVLLGAIAVLLQMNGRPLHQWWMSVCRVDWLNGLFGSLLGGLAGGGVVWFTRAFGSILLGKEAMGLGDVDLMFGVGAVIGPGAVVVSFFLAPLFGLPIALAFLLLKSRRQIPYGPYLSLASLAVMLFYFPIYDYLRPGVMGLGFILRSIF